MRALSLGIFSFFCLSAVASGSSEACQFDTSIFLSRKEVIEQSKEVNTAFQPLTVNLVKRFHSVFDAATVQRKVSELTGNALVPVPIASLTRMESVLPQSLKAGYTGTEIGSWNLRNYQRSTLSVMDAGLEQRENVLIFVPPPRRAERWQYTTAFQMNTLVAPVGEYGEKFHKKLALTAAMLIDETLSPEVKELSEKIKDHFAGDPGKPVPEGKVRIARMLDGAPANNIFPAPQQATVEGITTLYQALAMLSQERVGELSGEELVQKLLTSRKGSNGVVATFAQQLSPGFMGPASLTGKYFPHAIVPGEDGFPAISAKLLEFHKNRKLKNISSVSKGDITTWLGCPLARLDGKEKSTVQQFADAFLEIFSQIEVR